MSSGRAAFPARTMRLAVLLIGLLVASCAGGGSDAGIDASSGSRVLQTTVTAAPMAPTTSPEPAVASTSAEDRQAEAEQQVRAAVAASYEAFSGCLLALPNCDPASLSSTRAGTLLDQNTRRIAEWNSAGYAVRDRQLFRFVIEKVEFTDPASLTQATVIACIADGSRLVRPGVGPGGVDVIVDGAYTSARDQIDLRRDPDGRWRAYAGVAIGSAEARDVCPAG